MNLNKYLKLNYIYIINIVNIKMSDFKEFCLIERYESDIYNDLWDYFDYHQDNIIFDYLNINKVNKFFDKYMRFDLPMDNYSDEEDIEDY